MGLCIKLCQTILDCSSAVESRKVETVFAGEGRGYKTMLLTRQYQHRPMVPCHLTKLHMSSLDLLRHGTSCVGTDVSPCSDTLRQKSCSPTDTVRQVAQVRDWSIRCVAYDTCRVVASHTCCVFLHVTPVVYVVARDTCHVRCCT